MRWTRDEHVSKANKALVDTMIPNRVSRANLTAAQWQVEELQIGLAKLRKDNERSTSACFLWATHPLNSSQREIACGLCAKRSRRARRTMSAAKLQISSVVPAPPCPRGRGHHELIGGYRARTVRPCAGAGGGVQRRGSGRPPAHWWQGGNKGRVDDRRLNLARPGPTYVVSRVLDYAVVPL